MVGTLPVRGKAKLMYRFLRQVSRRLTRQHFTTMLLLAGFVAALVPIPVSLLTRNEKDRSLPFPCQDRPCACRSAEQCRKKCCCFTPSQKMAWGRARGITMFDVVTESETPMANSASPKSACCSLKSPKAAPIKSPIDSRQPETVVPPVTRVKMPVSRTKVVIGMIAQKCQGVEQSFSGFPMFILPSFVELECRMEPVGERIVSEVILLVRIASEPPVPPPRLFVA